MRRCAVQARGGEGRQMRTRVRFEKCIRNSTKACHLVFASVLEQENALANPATHEGYVADEFILQRVQTAGAGGVRVRRDELVIGAMAIALRHVPVGVWDVVNPLLPRRDRRAVG